MNRTTMHVLDKAGSALAHPGRRAILALLEQAGELSPGEVAQAFPGLSRQAVSKQLGVLRHAGLVTARRRQRVALHPADQPERQALVLFDAARAKGAALLYALDKRPLSLLLCWLGETFWPVDPSGPPAPQDLG